MKLKKMVCNSKIRIDECHVVPVVIYGSECWTISEGGEREREKTLKQATQFISMWKDKARSDNENTRPPITLKYSGYNNPCQADWM